MKHQPKHRPQTQALINAIQAAREMPGVTVAIADLDEFQNHSGIPKSDWMVFFEIDEPRLMRAIK